MAAIFCSYVIKKNLTFFFFSQIPTYQNRENFLNDVKEQENILSGNGSNFCLMR